MGHAVVGLKAHDGLTELDAFGRVGEHVVAFFLFLVGLFVVAFFLFLVGLFVLVLFFLAGLVRASLTFGQSLQRLDAVVRQLLAGEALVHLAVVIQIEGEEVVGRVELVGDLDQLLVQLVVFDDDALVHLVGLPLGLDALALLLHEDVPALIGVGHVLAVVLVDDEVHDVLVDLLRQTEDADVRVRSRAFVTTHDARSPILDAARDVVLRVLLVGLVARLVDLVESIPERVV